MSENRFLTLARNAGESIQIKTTYGETITFCVHSFKGDQCKLSFVAPEDVQILRTELLSRETIDDEVIEVEA
jgi:carbon storage regulator CsrA